MASTTFLQQAYLAYFGRPADAAGLLTFGNDKVSEASVIASFSASAESQQFFGSMDPFAQINTIYKNLFNREAEPAGLNHWAGKIISGEVTLASAAMEILKNAQNSDKTAVANKLAASAAFTAAIDTTAEIIGYAGAAAIAPARAFLAAVTSEAASLTAATSAKALDASIASVITAGSTAPVGQATTLTAGVDIINGTGGNDTFKANIVQNIAGQQVNTLASGDELNGGAGTDTLNAKITSGAFAGDSVSMPIQPETKSLEIIKLEAASSDVYTNNYTNTQVYVNAKDMEGVSQLWSNRSDADLTIMNMTTKGTNQLSDMTIGMAYTGNKDSKWGASDYTVYFDQDYLTSAKTSTNPSVDFLAMNEDNYDKSNGANPLEGVFFRQLQFKLNGKTYDLTQYLGEKAEGKGDEIKTYAEFLKAVEGALVKVKAANATDAALQTVTASFGQKFTTDKNPNTNVLREGVAVRLTIDAETGGTKNVLEVKATDLEVARAGTATAPNNNRYEKADATPPVESDKPVTINVALEKVGLAGDGGSLIVGSMNKKESNEWDAVKTVVSSTKAGIEQFNVTVSGDATKNSSLAALHSTNNVLHTVNVASAAGSTAKLTIGNSNTFGGVTNAMKDVRTFDSTKFENDLTLGAKITAESVAKYMNLKDTAEPTADNVTFAYNFGKGNDTFNLAIDEANLAAAGTTTREDFVLNIAGNAGNDKITVTIASDEGTPVINPITGLIDGYTNTNWYANSKLNANLSIDGGEGNDTITTKMAGDWKVVGGAGDDVVYDNVNAKANTAWVLNGTATDLKDIKSSANDKNFFAAVDVSVTFKGITVTKSVNSTNGFTSDLQINQAIKEAISTDATLKALLVAKDGPSNSLVIESLVDGAVAGDLNVAFARTATLSQSEADKFGAEYRAAYIAQGIDPALSANGIFANATTYGIDEVTAIMDAHINALTNNQVGGTPLVAATLPAIHGNKSDLGDYAATVVIAEATTPGQNQGDGTFKLGTGNDILVLDVNAESSDTVVYSKDEKFDNDTIVNFAAHSAGRVAPALAQAKADKFDFTALGGDILAAKTNFAPGSVDGDVAVNFVNLALPAGERKLLDAGDTNYSNGSFSLTSGGVFQTQTQTVEANTKDYFATPTAGVNLDVVAPATTTESLADKSIVIVNLDEVFGSTGSVNNERTEVAKYVDDTTASTHVVVVVDKHNVGSVYAVVDGTGASDAEATLMGTIDLGNTGWYSLTAENFV